MALMDNELGIRGVVEATFDMSFVTVEFGVVGVFAGPRDG